LLRFHRDLPGTLHGSTLERSTGAPYWLVRGTLHGRQIRKEFNRRVDAMAHAEARNAEVRGGTADEAPVLTHLKPDRVREAENVIANLSRSHPEAALSDIAEYYRRYSPLLPPAEAAALAPALTRLREKFPDVSAATALGWFIEHYRLPASAISLQIALENYLSDVARRFQKNSLSRRQFLSVGRELSRVEAHFAPTTPLANLDQIALQEFLRTSCGDSFSNKTWNNRRGYLTAFFNFCRQEGWLDQNPPPPRNAESNLAFSHIFAHYF
jgi:hypothetical protein